VRIYKSVIRPVLTYAAETCADTSETKQILETTEINTLRKIVGKKRLYNVRNQDTREQCGIQPIGEWVNKRRMTEDRIVSVVRDNSPKSKMKPGRPRKRWSDSYST